MIILKIIHLLYIFICKKIDDYYNYFWLYIRHVSIGNGVIINGKIDIYGLGNVSIGNSVIINSNIKFNPIGGQSGTILRTIDNGNISIADNTGMSNVTICASKEVYIGKNVNIGGDVRIYDTDFHSIKYEHRMEKPDKHIQSKPVLIKDGVWIGASSIILKGVIIGSNSIVGAGSVVTKSIPENQIWAGNPARFIRNIEDNTCEHFVLFTEDDR